MKAGSTHTSDRARMLWAFAITSIALFMTTLDNLVVTTALPVIRKDLDASLSGLEWTVNAYTLTFAVLLLTGAATRDPRAFDRPDDFDVERPPNVAIGLGHGVHSCLGAALARMESRIAIEEIANRWQRLHVDASGLQRVHMANVAGYKNVPVNAVR